RHGRGRIAVWQGPILAEAGQRDRKDARAGDCRDEALARKACEMSADAPVDSSASLRVETGEPLGSRRGEAGDMGRATPLSPGRMKGVANLRIGQGGRQQRRLSLIDFLRGLAEIGARGRLDPEY